MISYIKSFLFILISLVHCNFSSNVKYISLDKSYPEINWNDKTEEVTKILSDLLKINTVRVSEDINTMHGKNENISIENLRLGSNIIFETLIEMNKK